MGHRADPEFDSQVAHYTGMGLRQKFIAHLLHTTRGRVSAAQKRQGLRAWQGKPNTETELAILNFSEAGLSGRQITELLGVSDHFIRRTRHTFGFQPLGKRDLDPVTFVKLKNEILRRSNHAIALSEKYGLSYKETLRIAREVLGVPKLRPGRTPIPLSSDFPELPVASNG